VNSDHGSVSPGICREAASAANFHYRLVSVRIREIKAAQASITVAGQCRARAFVMPIDHRTDSTNDCRTAIAASDAIYEHIELRTHSFLMAPCCCLFNELIAAPVELDDMMGLGMGQAVANITDLSAACALRILVGPLPCRAELKNLPARRPASTNSKERFSKSTIDSSKRRLRP
jgi:hypothetical protein